MKEQIVKIQGEIELEISDSRFLSGRVYLLLRFAVEEYPQMPLIDALDWAKKLETKLCKQESIRKDAYEISVLSDLKVSLKEANRSAH